MSSNKHAQEELKNFAYTMVKNFKVWVIPYANVQEKEPFLPWREYQDEEFDEDKIKEILETVDWSKVDGLGILLGPPSQFLVMFDFDIPECKKQAVDDYKCYELHQGLSERVLTAADEIFVEYGAVQTIHQGLHILVRLSKEDWEKLKETIGTCKTRLGQMRAGASVFDVELMLCKTVTPVYGKGYEFFNPFIPLTSLDKVKQFVAKLGLHLGKTDNRQTQVTTTPTPGAGRRLTDAEITAIVEIMKNYWVSGHRNNLQLSLLGWLIKRGIPQEDAEKLFNRLTDVAADEKKKKRMDEVRRQYRLVETGQKSVQKLLGKSGLLTELQHVIKEQNPGLSEEEARDRALAVVAELEKVLGPRRTILVRTPYKTNTWFVNDPQRGIVLLKERRDENGEVRRSREYISDWYVKRVLVVRGEGQYNYRVLFVNARTREKLVLTGQMDEIARELRRIHGVKRSQVITDAVSAIISELIRRKVAKVRKTAAVAGILPVKNGVKLVRVGALSKLRIPREPDPQRAKEALQLLIELRRYYDEKKFDVAINWAAYAPVSYVLKKRYGIRQLYLLLHGERGTGKTTLARIISKMMFDVKGAEGEDIPEEGQSEYRLAWKLNSTTVPVLEDEVQSISRKPSLIGLLKRAASGDIVRWRGDTNTRYRARTPIVFTSNYPEIITDPALADRMISILFTHGDSVKNKPEEEKEEFDRLLDRYKAVAAHLGAVLLQTIVKYWSDIASEWAYRIHYKDDYIKFGQWVWRKVAERLGVEPPPWATAEIKLEEENPDELVEEAFWNIVHDVLADYARLNRCDGTVLGCLANLGEKGLLPSTLIEWSPGKVVVKAPILQEIERRLNITVFGGLRGLAEKLGLEYKSVRMRGKITKGIVLPISELVKRIGGQDDVVEYLAEVLLFKYNMERWGENDNGVAPHVIEEARKLGIEVDRQTAYRVATKLFILSNKRRSPEAEYLELEEVTA